MAQDSRWLCRLHSTAPGEGPTPEASQTFARATLRRLWRRDSNPLQTGGRIATDRTLCHASGVGPLTSNRQSIATNRKRAADRAEPSAMRWLAAISPVAPDADGHSHLRGAVSAYRSSRQLQAGSGQQAAGIA